MTAQTNASPFLERIKQPLLRLGLGNGILYLFDRAIRRLSADRIRIYKYALVAQPVLCATARKNQASSNSTIRKIEAGDEVIQTFPRSNNVIRNRFQHGGQCYVAEVRGRFAGYLWIARDGYDEDEVRCRFEFEEAAISAWDYDVYVDPAFRMGRTFLRLWEHANCDMWRSGVRWTYSRISAFNPRSLSAHRKLGMVSLHHAIFICAWRVQVAAFTLKPYLHVSMSPQSRPLLVLPRPIIDETVGAEHHT